LPLHLVFCKNSKPTNGGNVRELKNVIERAVILAEHDSLTPEVLPHEIQYQSDQSGKSVSAFSLASVEKLQIQKVLNYTKGNKAETARLLEIDRDLYRKLDEYKIQ
jgi:DNA-binding NtrC family response regulator